MTSSYNKSKMECACCGRKDHLKFCESCQVWMCFDIDEEIGGCWEWTSSHESMCQEIFNYHHPNLDEEMAFYDKIRKFEECPPIP